MRTLRDEIFDEVGFDEAERALFLSCLAAISEASKDGEDPRPRVRKLVEREVAGHAVQED